MSESMPDKLISALLDGELDAQQAESLSQWVTASPEHARYIASLTVIERGLVQRCKKESAGNLLAELAEMEANAEIDGLVDLTEELKHRKRDKARADAARRAHAARTGAGLDTPRSVIVIPSLAAIGAIAAMLLIAAMIYWRVGSQPTPTDPAPITHDAPQPGHAPTQQVILAQVVDQVDTRWAGQQSGAAIGERLYGGELTLARGTVELEMDGGGTLIIEGPARFTLRDEGRVELAYGRVVSIVPTAAPRMMLLLPGVSYENEGATFGCVATSEGTSRADVFAGSVRALAINESPMRLDAGQAVEARGGTLDLVPTQRSGYVRDLAQLHYRDAVLADSPVSYWPLQDEPAALSIEDAIRGGLRLYPRLAPLVQVPGPMGGEALLFSGEGILDLAEDGEMVTSRYNQSDAFTFEAWVRPEPMTEAGYLIVANTDERERSGSGWGVGVRPSGRDDQLVPFLTVGAEEWLFTGTRLRLGRWTHLVVTRDRDGTACLYLDGREVARHSDTAAPSNSPQYVHLAGRLTRERWRGGLAHVAHYDRRLQPDEISQHAQFEPD